MPRASSKKASTNSTASANSSAVDLFRAASGKAASKELERIDQLFYSYCSNGSGIIDPEGIEALCSDLEVDHTDVRILMLAWKMQAAKQGYFTLDEWRTGLKAVKADTIPKLKKALVDIEKEVRRPTNFLNFYSYAFRYCLTEEKQKSVDIESVCLLLDLVLGSQFRPQVDAFTQYLKIQTDYKVINMDQWMGFYRFCNEVAEYLTGHHQSFSTLGAFDFVVLLVSFPDMSDYDSDLAWPWILDNFVDWLRSNGGKF